jgi:hypothetical protein
MDIRAKKDSNDTPISKVGRLMGIVMIQRKSPLKGKLYRINPKAVGVPSSADTTAVPNAMIVLFFNAGQMILFSRALEYQVKVKPSKGKTPVVLLLKDRTISIMTGKNKNNNAITEYIWRIGKRCKDTFLVRVNADNLPATGTNV